MSKTVIILGAGFSRAAVAEGKPVAERPPLDADFFEIARRGNHGEYLKGVSDALTSMVGNYSAKVMESLETASTYLYLKAMDSSPGSIYHLGFLHLLDLLTSVLKSTTNSLPLGAPSLLYRFLLGELRKLDKPEDLSIITFNYDLLVEKILDRMHTISGNRAFQFPECYRLDEPFNVSAVENAPKSYRPMFYSIDHDGQVGVSIFKLHGSFNWVSMHDSKTPEPRELFDFEREIYVLNCSEVGIVELRGEKIKYGKPIIVPPVSGKRGMMHNKIISLWLGAAKALKEADRIIVTGYSCPPIDVEARMLLSENLRQNSDKKLYIIDPNVESAAKFINICGVDHSTIYSSIGRWIKDDPDRGE